MGISGLLEYSNNHNLPDEVEYAHNMHRFDDIAFRSEFQQRIREALANTQPKPRRRWSDRSATAHRSTHRPIGDFPDRVKRRRQRHTRRQRRDLLIVRQELALVAG